MDIFNLIIFILLFAFLWFGLWYGIWHILSGIVSLVLGIIIASHWYEFVGLKLLSIAHGNLNLARILGFLLIFIGVRIAVSLFFALLKKVFRLFSFVPFQGLVNHLIGGILGLVIGGLVIGFILDISIRFPLSPAWIARIASSEIALFLIRFSHILTPLIPQTLREIESVVP